MDLSPYLRADLAAFAGYSSAATTRPDELPADPIWLNANESAWANAADPSGRVRRYPAPQPPALREALAEFAGVAPEQVLAGRGSDELIDLLVRLACAPGSAADRVVISTPTFGMYAIAATLNANPVVDIPLREVGRRWAFATETVAEAAERAKLVFICSPGNPTGQAIPDDAVERVLRAATGHALVVVDEAYTDFADQPSAVGLLDRYPNLVVLRTLSKAHALAGARLGYAVADPDLIGALGRVQAPYPIPQPVATLALQALTDDATAESREHVAAARSERERLLTGLSVLPCTAYPSEANFVLVRVPDVDAALRSLREQGIIVRDARTHVALPDGIRITVGTPEQTELVLTTLRKVLA